MSASTRLTLDSAQATLHTQAGEAADGTCNQWGCASGMGAHPYAQPPAKSSDGLYGRGAAPIDTRYPFEVVASFDALGHMDVTLSQQHLKPMSVHTSPSTSPNPGSHRSTLWSVASAGNAPLASVPEEASRKVAAAMQDGMVLVASLWGASGDAGMAWLDGGCDPPSYTHCQLSDTTARIYDMSIESLPPSPPPEPRPPMAPPPYLCAPWCNEWTVPGGGHAHPSCRDCKL